MNPLLLPFLKDVLKSVLETKLVKKWLDHMTKKIPTKLDDMLVDAIRAVLGIKDIKERDAAIVKNVAALQRVYDFSSKEERAVLHSPSDKYLTADVRTIFGLDCDGNYVA